MFSLFKIDTPTEFPPLMLFNSESRELEEFVPRKKHEVTMYSCGPTVYDFAHIGNLRTYVFADTLKRVLLINGYEVNHTMNYTDFGHLTSDADTGDDKMMKGLKREGMDITLENMRLLSDRYIKAFEDDLTTLNIIFPTQFARASDYVKEQISLIASLSEKGYLYETSDGLYFDISKFPTYGRLGNINVESLKSGSRVEENAEKKHPADFAVWKKAELGWDSDWDKGFPGWHIECSAMAFATLGKQIDIHTGGVDNMPTHHNGEIAQCEAATSKQFVSYWLHGEHLNLSDKKISKSAGGGLYMDTLKEHGIEGDEYRYWLLTAHYRTNANFSWEALEGAKQALTKLKRLVYEEWKDEKGKRNETYYNRFIAAVNDDLDTASGIALLWELVKDDSVSAGDKKITIQECDAVLGVNLSLESDEGQKLLGFVRTDQIPETIQIMLEHREAARIAHNWAEADVLREKIKREGYEVEDGPDGPKLTKSN